MTDDTGVSRPRFLVAALWALLAAGSFTVMIASVRYMDGKFDAFEIVFSARWSEFSSSFRW